MSLRIQRRSREFLRRYGMSRAVNVAIRKLIPTALAIRLDGASSLEVQATTERNRQR